MEFINISGRKLKVILSKDECARLGIDTSQSEITGTQIRSIIRDILSLAGEKCGFFADGERILAQLYPLPDGDCELLITRLGTVPRREREILSSTPGISVLESRRSVYRFSLYEDLVSAVRAIRSYPYADLYRAADGSYYISIDEDVTDGISELAILIEYGEQVSSLPIDVVSEYGEMLSRGRAFDYILEHPTL